MLNRRNFLKTGFYEGIKFAVLVVGLLVLVGCGTGGKIEFKGEYDPENGVVSVDLGNGTTSGSVAVELPEVSVPPEGGTLPSIDELEITDDPVTTEQPEESDSA